MNTKLSVLFFVKRTITNFDGLLPIFIRVTVNGARIEFSTKRLTTSEKWSVEGNRMKGTSAETKATNSYFDTLKAKVYDYQQQLIREDNLVNAENMRNKILGVEKRSLHAYWHFSTAQRGNKSPCWSGICNCNIYPIRNFIKTHDSFPAMEIQGIRY